MKTVKAIAILKHSIRSKVVLNHFPENEDVVNRSKLVPGEFSYTNAAKSTRSNSDEQNHITIFGDSIFRGIHVLEFSNEMKIGFGKFKDFPGKDSREILH